MNLLIFEYFSGGGYGTKQLSSRILSESYAILRSLIFDLKAAGHNVTTFLDLRLKLFDPPNEADKIIAVSSPNELYRQLNEFLGKVDAVYVIAPESNQTLQRILEKVTISGVKSLNCEVEAVKSVSNKMKNYEILKKTGLKVPKTILLELNENIEKIKHTIKKLGFPLVFKPIDGISCDGLSVVKNYNQMELAVKKIKQESTSKKFIVQKLLRGKAASVCVFSTGVKALSVTLNKQLVTLASPTKKSRYHGGVVPFNHQLERQALRIAEVAVEAIKGLKGYVGVDMILTEENPIIIEINPRLTVSYIGLSRAMNFNPAEAIVDSIIKGKLPKNVHKKRFVYFSKVKFPFVPKILAETYKLREVISPPFPVGMNKTSFALIASSSRTSRGAQTAFYRAKKNFLSLYGGD